MTLRTYFQVVIPAQAGIQFSAPASNGEKLGPRLRGDDIDFFISAKPLV